MILEEPKIEVVSFDAEMDVIATSPCAVGSNAYQGGGYCVGNMPEACGYAAAFPEGPDAE